MSPKSTLLPDRNAKDLAEENRQLKEQLARLQNRLRFDPLTQVLSKAGFYETFAALASRGDVLFFLDIDDFKSVNDNYGHEVGDRLLVAIGQALAQAVSPKGSVGRLAGDEFLILMPEGSLTGELAFVDLLCAAVQGAAVCAGDIAISRSVSVGTARVDLMGNPEPTVVNANSALRLAKQSGKNRGMVFDANPVKVIAAPPTIDEIRLALKRGEIGYYVQPVYDLTTMECTGYEALLRWTRRNGEVLGPSHFLNTMATVHNRDTKPLLESARTVAHWATCRQGKTIAFNVSTVSLRHFAEDGPDWISQIVGDAPRAKVVFELVETIVDGEDRQMAETVAQLRALGIRIALDDFGTGHSTLQRLQSVPVDYVKVDRHFLEAASQSERGEEILRSIVEVIRASGAEAIVEGIQDAAQLDLVKSISVTHGQGFYLGRPAPIEAWNAPECTCRT